MNDIPDWAGKRACELLNAEAQISEWRWPRDHESPSVVTVAKLVMQHEQPPAFPQTEYSYSRPAHLEGMNLRDWFAGQALSGMSDDGNDWSASDYAKWAYALADAMLAERSK